MTALLRLSAGLVVWAAGFCVIYGLHGIGCANDWPARSLAGFELHRLVLIAAWIATAAVNVGIAVWASARRADVLDRAAIITNWAAVAATVVTFLPLLPIAPCL